MTRQEIYVLNRALDGGPIYNLKGFEELKISEFAVDSIKDRLIKRNLLKDKLNLSEKGAMLVRRIKEYKEAKTYLSLNNLTVGLDENHTAVAMIYNPLYEEYKFSKIDAKDCVEAVMNCYSFLGESTDDEVKIGEMEWEEVNERYLADKKKHLKITVKRGESECYAWVFQSDDTLYRFDKKENVLFQTSAKAIRNFLSEEIA